MLPAFGAIATLLLSGCQQLAQPPDAPRSSLPRANAITLAQLTASSIGGEVFSVSPTGSMRPTLDEHSVVALERVDFAHLRPGDIVIYRNRAGWPIIHRLLARQGNAWVVVGDANPTPDQESVTPSNLVGRVCAIFYSSEGLPTSPTAIASASPGGKSQPSTEKPLKAPENGRY